MNSYLFYIRPCNGQLPAYHHYVSAKSLPEAWGILGIRFAKLAPVKFVKHFATSGDMYREFPEVL